MDQYRILNIVMAKVWGGGEQYVYDTSKAMTKIGYKVYVAVDYRNENMCLKFAEVADVIKCDLLSIAGLRSFCRLRSFIENKSIEIINCHSGHAMILALLLKKVTGVKLVMFKHNAVCAKFDFYHKWQRKVTDAFICVSRLVYDMQTKGLNNIEKERFYLVYNGIDVSKFRIQKKTRYSSNYVVGYAGRIASNKGIDILLQAIYKMRKKHSNIKLLLAGSSEKDYLKKIKEYISNSNMGSCVEYVGYVDNMVDFYERLNLFVLPSVVREAFGLVLCEAMYCEVPVITTDSGAQQEIIQDGFNGFIVNAGDIDSLESMMEKVYIDKQLVAQITKNAKYTVETKFTVEKCVRNIINVYNIIQGE